MDESELDKRFQEFAAGAAEFTRHLIGTSVAGETDKAKLSESNLNIAKMVFGKWCIEIFVILYNSGPVGFENLRRDLGRISPRVLSDKLKMMERQGLIQRTLIASRPPGARYSLTAKGVTVARLGEPVFLYLSFKGLVPVNVVKSHIHETISVASRDAIGRNVRP
jgi:DNA-binding HxlR family transcriptional regulator